MVLICADDLKAGFVFWATAGAGTCRGNCLRMRRLGILHRRGARRMKAWHRRFLADDGFGD